MGAKLIAALLFVLAALLCAVSPALAGYECTVKNMTGDPVGRYDRVEATAMDDNRFKTHVERIINLGNFEPKRYARFFVINYWSSTDRPWIATNMSFNFMANLKAPNRPLFAFLILDTGDYVERLVMDANGRDNFGSMLQFSPKTPEPKIMASFGFSYQSSIDQERRFLAALGQATSMAIELKYFDGQTLARETVSVSHLDMESALNSAREMYRGNKEKCEFIPQQVEF